MTIPTEVLPATRTLTLMAPLSGFSTPLERVPDPVFSQKMVGDGIAVDPISESLVAPCDGEVIMLHPASHALTLAIAGGLDEWGKKNAPSSGTAYEKTRVLTRRQPFRLSPIRGPCGNRFAR